MPAWPAWRRAPRSTAAPLPNPDNNCMLHQAFMRSCSSFGCLRVLKLMSLPHPQLPTTRHRPPADQLAQFRDGAHGLLANRASSFRSDDNARVAHTCRANLCIFSSRVRRLQHLRFFVGIACLCLSGIMLGSCGCFSTLLSHGLQVYGFKQRQRFLAIICDISSKSSSSSVGLAPLQPCSGSLEQLLFAIASNRVGSQGLRLQVWVSGMGLGVHVSRAQARQLKFCSLGL